MSARISVLTSHSGHRILMNNSPKKLLPLVLLCSASFLYLSAFKLPFVPILKSGDWMVYAMNGARVAQGEMMYKDFFEFVLPGTDAVYAGLFKLLGPRVWIPNATAVLLGLAIVALGVSISKHVLRGPAAYLPSILFLTAAYWEGGSGNPTHHWFSVLAALSALAVLMKSRSPARLAAAGAFCALAAFFTQIRGMALVLGLAAFIIWECRRQRCSWGQFIEREISLISTFIVTLAALCAYFIHQASWQRFFYCTITFGLKYYPLIQGNNIQSVYLRDMPPINHWYGLLLVLLWLVVPVLVPFVYLIFNLHTRRRTRADVAQTLLSVLPPQDTPRSARAAEVSEPACWEGLVLLNVVGLSMFAAVVGAPSWLRLATASFPAFFVLVWLMRGRAWLDRLLYYSCWGAVFILMIAEPLRTQAQAKGVLAGPAGVMTTDDPLTFEALQWLEPRTKPSEYFFDIYLGGVLNFALQLRNPTASPFLEATDYTRPEEVLSVVEHLEKRQVPLIFTDSDTMYPTSHASGDHLDPFRAFLIERYYVARNFEGGFQVWERKAIGQQR